MLKTAHSQHETKIDSAVFSLCVFDHAVLGSRTSRVGGRIDSFKVYMLNWSAVMPFGVLAALYNLPASVASSHPMALSVSLTL